MDDMQSHIAAALLFEKIARGIYPSKGPGEILPLQWAILRHVERNEPKWCTIKYVAHFLGLTPGAISRAAGTLRQRNLIEIESDEHDARMKILSLTDSGVEALRGDPILLLAKQIGELSESKRTSLKSTIQTLILNEKE